MDKYIIIANEKKDRDFVITEQTKQCIEQFGVVEHIYYTTESGKVSIGEIDPEVRCVFTIGGDGTLIQAARSLIGTNVSILGINRGTLGYLTEVDVKNLEEAIARVSRNEFTTEERMMICGKLPDRQEDVALNDIVVTRHGSVKIIHYRVYVNGEFLNSFQADGMIVSTPTGSTAYNLSAGGPIVEPTAALFVITPICSHALNTRSIVLSASDRIEIEIGEGRGYGEELAEVAFDGADIAYLRTGERIVIRQADVTAKLMKLSKESFLETLREKMKGN